ncbi:glycosyltransferase family 4 protein [Mucilaginibacter sp. L196]|uniref:glycosyltransferase family 4 protein n=1 Tax=Mucilaginibacter sp. L196 TaxID=1641870 RepID=UPI00131D4EBD|nr:glycosyltransferase family 4 protein [Mucilaginibacter sp. L196]
MKTEQDHIDFKKKKIAIVTSCDEDWGGSEELWGKSIAYFIEANYAVTVYKNTINFQHPEFIKLANTGVDLIELKQPVIKKTYATRLRDKLKRIARGAAGKRDFPKTVHAFTKKLINSQPNLVIVSQGINFDGLMYAALCLLQNIPYIIISQKAVDFYWPRKNDRAHMANAFKNALHCFFVSKHNLVLTEEQFGFRFNNASVIQNPNKVKAVEPYPDDTNGIRLACVGRLFILDKGQDILLRIMTKPKWRERNISISFIGSGIDEAGLKDMARLLDIKNVKFTGFVDDITTVCKQHHAFIQPSRSEGLPLAIVEAMAAGRPVIASKAGGNAEIIQDGVTGYIGHANEDDFDEAMEKAWKNRHNWQAMGLAAANHITKTISLCPEAEFIKKVITLIDFN